MASRSDSLLPVLLLAGLAGYLMYQRGMLGTLKRAPATSGASRNSASADKIRAVGTAISGFISSLGGVTGGDGNWSSDRPSDAALDQVVSAAQAWQQAYGGITGADGDPYGSWE